MTKKSSDEMIIRFFSNKLTQKRKLSMFFRKKASENFDGLIEAIKSGDLVRVRLIIQNGFDVNKVDCDGFSPLIFAAKFQQVEIVRYLVSAGADIHIKDKLGFNASMIASWHGEYRMGAYTDESLEIVAILEGNDNEQINKQSLWTKGISSEFKDY